MIGLSLGTLATAFTATAFQFVACQMVTRTFVLTASAVAVVIVAEELPASARGWGIGMLAAVSVIGHGLGAVMFSAIEVLPYGWRSLYALGMAVLAATTALGHVVVLSFTGYFVLEYHGWEAYQLSMMVIVAGAVGVGGNVIIRALSSELFPTSHRGTSTGVLVLMETLGAALGLFILGVLQQQEGALNLLIPMISVTTLIAAGMLFLFPETKQQELESLSASA